MIAKMYFSGRALFSGRSLLTAAAAAALAALAQADSALAQQPPADIFTQYCENCSPGNRHGCALLLGPH